MLYNLSEFMTVVKEDMGIKDIPLPVSDTELVKRFQSSALKEFSQRAPRIETIILSDEDRIEDTLTARYTRIVYRIPKTIIQDSTVLDVVDFDVASTSGFSDYYMPTSMWASPESTLESIADIQLAASLASSMSRSPTHDFVPPDKLYVYNGWVGGSYMVKIALTHDLSLSTIQPTAMTHLRQLAVLDLEEYLYGLLKRRDGLDIGIGSIQLKIDDWADAKSEKRSLLDKWDEEGANLDTDYASYI